MDTEKSKTSIDKLSKVAGTQTIYTVNNIFTHSQQIEHVTFKNLFIFNWRIITLQYCVGFWETSTWISCRYTYVPSFLKLPPTSHPSPPPGGHRALWVSWVNYPWLSILHTVIQMFPSYCLNSSHPLLPPLCPQVCSPCLCLHCCPTNSFISTIFLHSIYTH